jgi:hypothetical protein
VSSSLIALIAQFVDQRLERFVANSSKGSTIARVVYRELKLGRSRHFADWADSE